MALDTTTAQRHRLVTRSDFDGLVCAALLKELVERITADG